MRPSGLFHTRINLELRILQTVGRTPWTGDQSCRKAVTYTGQQKRRKNADRHMPPAGFELTIPVFEKAKTFHTLDRAAPVIYNHLLPKI
jgi:hypothetical protein